MESSAVAVPRRWRSTWAALAWSASTLAFVGAGARLSDATVLTDGANAFTTPLKVAWVVWLAWGIGQVYWYRFERASAATPTLPSGARVPRRTASPSTAGPVVTPSTDGTAQMITPHEVQTLPTPAAAEPLAAPAFDPSKAIVETFEPRDTSLDAIVAEMERYIPQSSGEASRVH